MVTSCDRIFMFLVNVVLKRKGNDMFLDSLSFLKDKISQKNAYLGVIVGFSAFIFSLFLSWAKAVDSSNVIDSGSSNGWDEQGYIAIIPFLFIIYKVIVNKKTSVFSVIVSLILSVIILLYDNVSNKSVWKTSGGCFVDDCVPSHNLGSALGSGFWIGFFSILLIALCSISWSFHKE